MTTTTRPDNPRALARVPFWRRPFRLIRDHSRIYLLMNLAGYGLVAIGFALGLFFPELSAARAADLEADGTGELVRRLFESPPLFALAILAVNVFSLTLTTIVLPSLVFPFAGIALFGQWAIEAGITLVPSTDIGWVASIPHTLTVLIELQAYLMFVFGAYLLGTYWVSPQLAGVASRRLAYVEGLKRIGLLAMPALLLLVIGAIWEAYSLHFLVAPLAELLL